MPLITGLFITKDIKWLSNNNNDEETVNEIENKILATDSLKQVEEEYYVYFYDYKDEDVEISSNVSSKLSSKKVYKVDTGSALNNKYVSEESNKNAKGLNDLKVKSSTVIKVSGEKIVAYYENDEIINNLK